jgi:hypothetical protein
LAHDRSRRAPLSHSFKLTFPALSRTVRAMKLRKITPADVVIFIGVLVNVIVIALILYYFVL